MLPHSKGKIYSLQPYGTLAHYRQVKIRNLQRAFFVQRVFNISFIHFNKKLGAH
jgi:hypothetical protein